MDARMLLKIFRYAFGEKTFVAEVYLNSVRVFHMNYSAYDEYTIWLCSKKKIEHKCPLQKYMCWVADVIDNELAIKWSGKLSCEAFNEKWEGKKNKYPTFKEWVRKNYCYCDV